MVMLKATAAGAKTNCTAATSTASLNGFIVSSVVRGILHRPAPAGSKLFVNVIQQPDAKVDCRRNRVVASRLLLRRGRRPSGEHQGRRGPQPRAVSVEPEALVRSPALRFLSSPVPACAGLSRGTRTRHPVRR